MADEQWSMDEGARTLVLASGMTPSSLMISLLDHRPSTIFHREAREPSGFSSDIGRPPMR
jgi:hypothetical protein